MKVLFDFVVKIRFYLSSLVHDLAPIFPRRVANKATKYLIFSYSKVVETY